MLKHKFGIQLFQDFLRSQYGEENLNFWLAVEDYKTSDESNRAERARMIYEDYVSTLSPTEVSKVFCALDCCILKTAWIIATARPDWL